MLLTLVIEVIGMDISVLREAGQDEALLGMSLSFYDHQIPLEEFWNEDRFTRAVARANSLAHKDGGHNKFSESIVVWIYIKATRGFWQEFDTYRAGVTKQSASTMHTLSKRPVTIDDFEVGTSPLVINAFNYCLEEFKNPESEYYKDITRLKENLPEGWLQERVVCTNYKVLRHIYNQRYNHRYKHWRTFCQYLLDNLQFPEFIVDETKLA